MKRTIALNIWIILPGLLLQTCYSQPEPPTPQSGCPTLTRPHLTQCNKYYRCLMLPSNKLLWLVTNCEEGLVFDNSLGVCVLSNSDWECSLSLERNGTTNNDDKNIYGVNNLPVESTIASTTTTTSTDQPQAYMDSDSSSYNEPQYDLSEMTDYEEPTENGDSDNFEATEPDEESMDETDETGMSSTFLPDKINTNLIDRNDNFGNYEILLTSSPAQPHNKSPMKELFDEIESSGDGFNNEMEKKSGDGKLPDGIKSNALVDKLQRLAQLVKDIENLNGKTKDENGVVTQLDSDFLAQHFIRIKQSDKNTLNIVKLPTNMENFNLEDISNMLKMKDGKMNTTMITNNRIKVTPKPIHTHKTHVSRDPFTKIHLISNPADSKLSNSKTSSYSNNQVVVNRPEGSVVFNVPTPQMQPSPDTVNEQKKNQNTPHLSDDMLKTILELSKQLVSSQQNKASVTESVITKPRPNRPHTVYKPIYITVPVPVAPQPQPSPTITITNNENKYHNSPEDNDNRKERYPTLVTKDDFEKDKTVSSESLPEEIFYDSYGKKHVIYAPHKSFVESEKPSTFIQTTGYEHYPPHDNYVLFSTSKPKSTSEPPPYFKTTQFTKVPPKNYPVQQVTNAPPRQENRPIQLTLDQDSHQQPSTYAHVTDTPPAKYNYESESSLQQTHPSNPHSQYPPNAVNSQFYQTDDKTQNYYLIGPDGQEHNGQTFKLVVPKVTNSDNKQYASLYQIEKDFEQQTPIRKKYGTSQSNPYYDGPYGPAAPLEHLEYENAENDEYNNDNEAIEASPPDSSDEEQSGPVLGTSFKLPVNFNGDDEMKLISLAGSYINYNAYKNAIMPLMNSQSIPISVLQCSSGVRQPNTTDCTRYYICSSSSKQVVGFDCPSYTAFNPETKMCDAATYAKCKPPTQMSDITIDDNKNAEMLANYQMQAVNTLKTVTKKSQKQKTRLKSPTRPKVRNPSPSPTVSARRKLKPIVKQATPNTISQAVKKTNSTRKRPVCRRPGKMADPNTESNYILCFKNEQGVMKRHTLNCAGSLVFCKKYSLCTKKSRCVNS